MSESPIMIVTGGSRGIGSAIARLAGERGYDVCVNYTASADRAEAVAQDIRSHGQSAIAVQADVSKPDDIERLFAETDEGLGKVDVLVNNAAISIEVAIADVDVDIMRSQIDTNLLGPMLTTRQAIRRMGTSRGGKGGVIVNISSISALYGGLPTDVVYAGTKGGLDAFTIGIAKEVAPDGIRVCGIRPGLIKTEMWDNTVGQEGIVAMGQRGVPWGRVGEVEEIANATLWMASPEASYVTGAILNVSGGRETFVRGAG
ncbi:MAG: SDR family oxidoreductase [Rhodospirillaceae bacterium]|jgi:NAD(P)-dependent dehydrogenase (short-subunit alcohol dehydrogenase family)|nr:SDR family oxidoreductase [Rhodospirillaceae bacterium]MBT6203616.1 SDR family oxidoreductase [Rhodospirillaceae bacterium]MBT7611981.1 SDR family oxidoreductase [Rhodospirillaceae bacterium]